MSMCKKDYALIANVISARKQQAIDSMATMEVKDAILIELNLLAIDLAKALYEENKAFNTDKFTQAATKVIV